MSAGKYDIVIEEGAGFDGHFTWRDENQALINLTGYTAKAEFKSSIDAFEPYISLTTENGGIVLGGALGTIELTPTNLQITSIKVNGGVWQLELYSGGSTERLLKGQVLRDQEVVR